MVGIDGRADTVGRGFRGLGGRAWREILRVPPHPHSQAGASGMWGSEVVLRPLSHVWRLPSGRGWPGLPLVGTRPSALCLCVWGQLFWEKKLSGLNAFDIAEELVKTMDLPKGLQGNRRGRACQAQGLLQAGGWGAQWPRRGEAPSVPDRAGPGPGPLILAASWRACRSTGGSRLTSRGGRAAGRDGAPVVLFLRRGNAAALSRAGAPLLQSRGGLSVFEGRSGSKPEALGEGPQVPGGDHPAVPGRRGARLHGRDPAVGHRQRPAHQHHAHHRAALRRRGEEPWGVAEHGPAPLQGLHGDRRGHQVLLCARPPQSRVCAGAPQGSSESGRGEGGFEKHQQTLSHES